MNTQTIRANMTIDQFQDLWRYVHAGNAPFAIQSIELNNEAMGAPNLPIRVVRYLESEVIIQVIANGEKARFGLGWNLPIVVTLEYDAATTKAG